MDGGGRIVHPQPAAEDEFWERDAARASERAEFSAVHAGNCEGMMLVDAFRT